MLSSEIYHDGKLLVGRFSGDIIPQSVFDGIFYQIDCHIVGEVKDNFAQLLYDADITSVNADESDVERIIELNRGMGLHRGKHTTALVFRHPRLRYLAGLYKEKAHQLELEVELFDSLQQGFDWLGYANPDPDTIIDPFARAPRDVG